MQAVIILLVAPVQRHVVLVKETVTLTLIALVIFYVELITASLHFHQLQTAAMTLSQVDK